MAGLLDFAKTPEFMQWATGVAGGLSRAGRGQGFNIAPANQQLFQSMADNRQDEAMREAMSQFGMSPQQTSVFDNMDYQTKQRAMLGMFDPQTSERRIVKGGDGLNYYADTGERVLPGVQSQEDVKRYNVGGALVDADGNVVYQGEESQTPRSPMAKLAVDYRNGLIDKETFEAVQRKYLADPSSITVDSDGTVTIGGKPLKEYEAKVTSYSRRMMDSTPRLNAAEDALMGEGGPSLVDVGADSLGAIGNFVKSPEYQTYQASAREWIAGLLRLDSGAAVPDTEFARYFSTFFIEPNDNPQTIANKKAARDSVMMAVGEITPEQVKAARAAEAGTPEVPEKRIPVEGDEAINRKTGEEMRFNGSEWEPIE